MPTFLMTLASLVCFLQCLIILHVVYYPTFITKYELILLNFLNLVTIIANLVFHQYRLTFPLILVVVVFQFFLIKKHFRSYLTSVFILTIDSLILLNSNFLISILFTIFSRQCSREALGNYFVCYLVQLLVTFLLASMAKKKVLQTKIHLYFKHLHKKYRLFSFEYLSAYALLLQMHLIQPSFLITKNKLISLLLCNTLAFVLTTFIQSTNDGWQKYENLFLKNKSFIQERQTLEEIYDFQHDYKNLLLHLQAYIEEQNFTGAQNFLKELTNYSQPFLADNNWKELDKIQVFEIKNQFAHAIERCFNHQIPVTLTITHTIDQMNIDSVVLVRCLSIICNNAIEASLAEPVSQINFSVRQDKAFTYLSVENYHTQPIDMQKILTKGYSSKASHSGRGLSILLDLARKYGFEITIEDNAHFFQVQLISANSS